MIDYNGFKAYLDSKDYSPLTKRCYIKGIEEFGKMGYEEYSIENAIEFKNNLVHQGLKSNSVNARLHGVNIYAKFLGKNERVKDIKAVLEPFLIDNMTYRDYRLLVEGLMRDRKFDWYIIVKMLATTGLRMQEAMGVTFGDVRRGSCRVYGKGQKPRTVYFSDPFRETIFPYSYNKADTDKIIPYADGYVRTQLMKMKDKYRLPCKCSPHEFRRFFAREVYARTKDLELVRGLLGHEDIKVTSRYIRKGVDQARETLSWAVTW